MIPIADLFESHLTVADLNRSMSFFGELLGLELAYVALDRKVAFYWIGGRGQAMLGLWEVQAPQRLDKPRRAFEPAGIEPRDFSGASTDEPVVLAWMPAASLFP